MRCSTLVRVRGAHKTRAKSGSADRFAELDVHVKLGWNSRRIPVTTGRANLLVLGTEAVLLLFATYLATAPA